jgi:glycosyltransferase involved in cell wall biosynthesis
MNAPDQLQFTGIVVTYNEERHLADCLARLDFCSELIVIDLGSSDRCVEIAKEHQARVIEHERVRIVEYLHQKALDMAQNDWVVLVDPDEVFPEGIAAELRSMIASQPELAVIKIRDQYCFLGKPLHTTRWGYEQMKTFVFHRKRVELNTDVHRNQRILPGYGVQTLEDKEGKFSVTHYWMDSYRQLFEKHRRYIEHEGEARYRAGMRFTWLEMSRDVLKNLVKNLFKYKGIIGGLRGIFLSFFYAWYVMKSWLSLRAYQRNRPPDAAQPSN